MRPATSSVKWPGKTWRASMPNSVSSRKTAKPNSRSRSYQLKLNAAELKLQVDSVTYTEEEKLSLAVFDERIDRADAEQEAANAKVERADERRA